MPFLDEVGLQTFWDICKDWFANKMTVENTIEKTTIALKTAEDETLASGEIGSATQETAGMMSAADKTKLDGIAENATANIGTITEVKGMSPITGAATQGSVTLGHADSGVSPGTFGITETIHQTPAFGSTFEVPGFSVNSTGHVTLAGSHNVRMPSAIASTSVNGLMSAEDKQKLDGIEEGATANIGTITGVSTTAPLSGSGVSGNVTISHGASGVDAGDYGDTTDQTPEFGETFKVLSGSVNATGHLTNFKEHNVTIPDAEATTASSGLMSAEDKAKLVGIASGAEVNQNAFSNVAVGTKTLVADSKTDTLNFAAGTNVTITADEASDTLTIAAKDTTYGDATASTSGLLSKEDKQKLDGIESGAQVNTITGIKGNAEGTYRTGQVNLTADNVGAVALTAKGVANGVAELDDDGKVPSSQLPSYVDDVLEYETQTAFPETGESGKIYVDTATNKTYRWSGSGYVEISASLALGTTASTAFRGDYGNTAYQHALAKGAAFSSGLYKITTNTEGHVTAATAVTKSDITDLGVPSTNTNTTYTLTKSGSTITLTGSDGSKTEVTDDNTTYTLSSFGLTATAEELNKLDGVTATTAELNFVDGVTSNIQTQLNSKAASTHSHDLATTTSPGFLRALSGSTNAFLRADGTWAVPPDTDTEYANFVGSTSSAAGAAGLVPAPAAGANTRYLRSDGTWSVPPDTNTTYTLSSFGITSTAAEINKLDGVTVSTTEINALAGVTSAIQTQLNGKAASTHNHSAGNITSGTLAVGRGGTGITSNPSMLINLASTTAASVFAASPRPGITGTLGIGHGGTGATTAAAARTNLGITVASDADFKAYMGIE